MASDNSVSRWRISGRLTFTSPLHVGNGGREERGDIAPPDPETDAKQIVEVATVERDVHGRPVIPGSTIKGVLLSAFRSAGPLADLARDIFGYEAKNIRTGKAEGAGGKAEFWFAPLTDPSRARLESLAPEPGQLPHWKKGGRLVAVRSGVTIDRDFRRAAEGRLFYQEYVPPGAEFEVTITGRNMSSEEVGAILWSLEQFNSGLLKIGSNASDGYGCATWSLDSVHCADTKETLRQWLMSHSAYDQLPKHPLDRLNSIKERLSKEAALPQRTSIPITLNFEGAFLSKHPIPKDMKKTSTNPDAVTVSRIDGRPFLPSSSFAGSMRSQAERILRTLGKRVCDCSDEHGSCTVTDESRRGNAGKFDLSVSLCLVCQLFGAPGWKSPLIISDFVLAGEPKDFEYRQEFVSIDRFTGGSSAGRKFNSTGLFAPKLQGTIEIDQGRMPHVDQAAWGLFALTLRDLREGDITFGHGASKGYGQCRAIVKPDVVDSELKKGILALRSPQ